MLFCLIVHEQTMTHAQSLKPPLVLQPVMLHCLMSTSTHNAQDRDLLITLRCCVVGACMAEAAAVAGTRRTSPSGAGPCDATRDRTL